MELVDIIGWIATAVLAFKAAPQAIKSHKRGNGKGLSRMFLWSWMIGQILMMIYLLLQPTYVMPVIAYVAFNIIMAGIIMRYRYFPRTPKPY